jgi:hypothetical protein
MFKKFVVSVFVLVFLVAVAIFVFPKFMGTAIENVTRNIFHRSFVSSFNSKSVLKDIVFDSQYVSLTQVFTTRGQFQDEQAANILNRQLPFLKQTRVLHFIFDQTIKLGINGKQIKIQEEGSKIIITMPPIEIISDEVDFNSVDFFKDETKGLFAKDLSANEKIQLVNFQKLQREKEVMANENYLSQARELAEKQIRELLAGILTIKNFEIVFVWDIATTQTPMNLKSKVEFL